jgi:glycolate oxidase
MGPPESLARLLGPERVIQDEERLGPYQHDESLTAEWVRPACVVLPESSDELAEIVRLANAEGFAITPRGGGTGLSGGARPTGAAVVVSTERLNQILEVDEENQTALVQAGVTLGELDEALEPVGLSYPVYPGELSATIGGTLATNAGGMRAVKYGVTRHNALGLTAVTGRGELIRTGGKFVKCSSGYDLTQLLVGSEGTLAVIAEGLLKLSPRPAFSGTLLAPFKTLDEVCHAVPAAIASGLAPAILEYIDAFAMAAMASTQGLSLGIPEDVKEVALAYLLILLESNDDSHLSANIERAGNLLAERGALDVYVLPPDSGRAIITARERAFYIAKAQGASDIVDVVVPRACMAAYLRRVAELASGLGALVSGCGHVGDGNVHLSVFQPDPAKVPDTVKAIVRAGVAMGGAVSGEHGIGTEKKEIFEELVDPVVLSLYRGIKKVFDPNNVLNPDHVFSMEVTAG